MNFPAGMPSLPFGEIFDALLHPSVGKLPAGFLLLTLAVLGIAALPDETRAKLKMAIMAAFGLFLSMEFSWPLNWSPFLG